MVLEIMVKSEQKYKFSSAQRIVAIGFATIFKKMDAICGFVEEGGGNCRAEVVTEVFPGIGCGMGARLGLIMP